MAGIKCPRLGLGETGIWREILMTSLCSLFTRDSTFGLAPAGLSPGAATRADKGICVLNYFCSHIISETCERAHGASVFWLAG